MFFCLPPLDSLDIIPSYSPSEDCELHTAGQLSNVLPQTHRTSSLLHCPLTPPYSHLSLGWPYSVMMIPKLLPMVLFTRDLELIDYNRASKFFFLRTIEFQNSKEPRLSLIEFAFQDPPAGSSQIQL